MIYGHLAGDDVRKPPGDCIQGLVPAGLAAVDAGPQQTPGLAQGLAQGGTLGAQSPEVGRVIGVPGNGEGPFWPWGDQNTATHPTVGVGGAYRRGGGMAVTTARPSPSQRTWDRSRANGQGG